MYLNSRAELEDGVLAAIPTKIGRPPFVERLFEQVEKTFSLWR